MLCNATSASWLEIGDIHLSDYFVVGKCQLPTSRLPVTNPANFLEARLWTAWVWQAMWFFVVTSRNPTRLDPAYAP